MQDYRSFADLPPVAPDVTATLEAPPAGVMRWTRREDVRLTTGTGLFVGDVVREGQLWLRVVRSPIAHGYVTGVETDEAARIPGVRAVLTGRDLGEPRHIPLRIHNKPELNAFLQPVLAVDKVRYVGEPVAVIVATSQRVAEDAAELVNIELEPLPAVTDVDGRRGVSVWESADDDVMCRVAAEVGDFQLALDRADHVVTAELETGRDTALPLETRGLVAEWEQGENRLHLWGPTKFLRFTRQTVAAWFGLAEENVVCHHVDVGGMFGSRGEIYPEDFLVPWASLITGSAVKWVEDRNEHLVSINHSRGQRHRVTVAATGTGELLGLRAEVSVDMGAYSRPVGGRVPELTVESLPGPYRWPSLDIRCKAVATNKTPVGTMRGPATFDTTFVRERVLDILAAELGRDPLELRLQNLISADEIPYVQQFGDELHSSVYDSGDYPRVVDALKQEMRYDELVADVRRRAEAGEMVGLGAAFFLDHSGLGREETVGLELGEDGRFTFLTTSSEVGQGLASMVAKVGAEALGVSERLIDVVTNETSRFDGGNGTFSSRGTIFVGSATLDAATRMRQALRDANPTADPGDQRAWEALAPLAVVGRHAGENPTFGFGLHLAVARIDAQTLDVVVERLGVGYDCGKVIDPVSTRGQLAGAAIHGLGGTLLQELTFDSDGQPQSTTFMDFLVPTVAEVPRVELAILEIEGTVSNPLGVKGVGEAGIMGVGGSVANAVSSALRAPRAVRKLPIRPDAIQPFAPELPKPPTSRRSRDVAPKATSPSRCAVTSLPYAKRMAVGLTMGAAIYAAARIAIKRRGR
jgi:carbon-monoxide dehydrogenase large subunit